MPWAKCEVSQLGQKGPLGQSEWISESDLSNLEIVSISVNTLYY